MKKEQGKSKLKIVFRVLIGMLIAACCCFFTTDLIRAKRYGQPPVFCVHVIEYGNGSRDYYGLGYKVWEDYHQYDKTTEYYMCFWFIPRFIHI